MRGDSKSHYTLILIAVALLIIIYFLPLPIQHSAKATIAITAFALVLWISEVIPLHITAIAVALLLIIIGGFSPEKVFSQFFDRIVVLVLGGFVLAVAMSKHKLDEYFAYKFLGRFNTSAKTLLLGMIFVTALPSSRS